MSGLPINTPQQAIEFRKQYMYYLALQAQNDAYNMQANRVYKETGQPMRPPDSRTTTEKLADAEEVRVSLLKMMRELTDGTEALEAVSNMTPAEIEFTYQMFNQIKSELKPRFSQGVPSVAFVSYIRALMAKELATSGVSFPAQEATAQSLLAALAAGRAAGAPIAPFAPPTASPTGPTAPPAGPTSPGSSTPAYIPPTFLAPPFPLVPLGPGGPSSYSPPPSGIIGSPSGAFSPIDPAGYSTPPAAPIALPVDPGAMLPIGGASRIDVLDSVDAFNKASWKTTREWYDRIRGNIPVDVQIEFARQTKLINLKQADANYLKLKMEPSKIKKDNGDTLSQAEAKDLLRGIFETSLANDWDPEVVALRSGAPVAVSAPLKPADPTTAKADPTAKGSGFRHTMYPGMRQQLQYQPVYHGAVRAPIQGWGLGRKQAKPPAVAVDMTKGVQRVTPTFVPFGKYIIDPAKLSRGQLELRTLSGGKVSKYPYRELSQPLSKLLKHILEDRLPDEYDIRVLDIDDQELLFNLAKDARINDRLNIPTPTMSRDEQTLNRFEILKGQIIAGNDGTEVVKEFKSLLVKLSDEGSIKKSEARDILMMLASMGR